MMVTIITQSLDKKDGICSKEFSAIKSLKATKPFLIEYHYLGLNLSLDLFVKVE